MGREKRKGKDVVVEKPVRKRTRAEREAERAEMVAKAIEEQATGRARPFSIREQPARGRGRGRGMGRVRGPGPPGPLHSRQRAIRLRGSRQLQIQTQIQRQHSQSSPRERECSGVTDSTTFWPHSADVPRSRVSTSDRASHRAQDARWSPATGALQDSSSSSSP
jgi:hypothetical protein